MIRPHCPLVTFAINMDSPYWSNDTPLFSPLFTKLQICINLWNSFAEQRAVVPKTVKANIFLITPVLMLNVASNAPSR